MRKKSTTDHVLIPLSQGRFAKIDPTDAVDVCLHKWFAWTPGGKRFYAATNIPDSNGRRTILLMHRLLMDVVYVLDDTVVDHINGDGLDNRRSNLRIATPKENARNSRGNNATGFKGVSFERVRKDRPNPRSTPFSAKIMVDRKTINLGRFATAEEAAMAYDRAAVEHFGEFALLNFPEEPA